MKHVHRKLFIYIGGSLLLTIIIDLPKFFEATWEEDGEGGSRKSLSAMRCQIHQHFKRAFFDDILVPKNFKPKTQICNF